MAASNYDQARSRLNKRYEQRMTTLVEEQERTREERAWNKARYEQDSMRAPQPSGGPKAQAPDVVGLMRRFERELRDKDIRQREALTKEHHAELQKIDEAERDGRGKNLGPNELAAMAMKPVPERNQGREPYKQLADEFNRQGQPPPDIDKDRLRIESDAAREMAIRQALAGTVIDSKNPPHRGRDIEHGRD